MSDDLRVAVIGHGLIGAQRAAAVHALTPTLPVKLVATVDPRERDESLYERAPHFASQDALLPQEYDCAIVSLPHDAASGSALRVLAEGKPVLVEKPLGRNLNEARSVATAASALSVPSFVGYNYRFLANISMLVDAVKSGRFGSVRSVELTIGHGGHPESATGWKLDAVRAGGGVLIDPGVHMIDILLQICPEVQLEYVTGTTGFWGTGVEEDAVAVFRAGKTVATLRCSHIRWLNTMRVEVWGTDGYGIAEGRGGNYGPVLFRSGTRWAWAESPKSLSQADSEQTTDFGTENLSLKLELEEVLRRWTNSRGRSDSPQPATMEQALLVSSVVDELYSDLSRLPAA